MKRIAFKAFIHVRVILILIILILSRASFPQAQKHPNTYRLPPQLIPSGFRAVPEGNHDVLMPLQNPAWQNITPYTALSTNCPNSNFHNGTFDSWQGCYGSITYINNPPPKPPTVTLSPCLTQGFSPIRHVIKSAPGYFDHFTCDSLLTVFPGEAFCARLGDTTGGGHAEQLKYDITVDSTSYLFVYRYAVVLESPGHQTPPEQPAFNVQIQDLQGNTIDSACGYYQFYSPNVPPGPSNPIPPGWHFCNAAMSGTAGIYWKDWTTIGMNLTPYLGQTIRLVFTTNGCCYSAHRGYAYISAYCSYLNVQTALCEGDTMATLTGPPGFDYLWNTGDTTQAILVPNPVTGAQYSCVLTSPNGCQVTIHETLTYTVVNTDFTHGTSCVNQSVDFTDQSTVNQNNVVDWRWDFGDLSLPVTGVQNPTHIYTSAGTYDVKLVSYSTEGCKDSITKQVFVTVLPVPTVSGANSICEGSTGVYMTEPNMGGYVWSVTAGGTITGGAGTSAVTVDWNTAGPQAVSVTYVSPGGCPAASPTSFPVTVNPRPSPSLGGQNNACVGSSWIYTTEAGMSNYTWTVTGGNITAGAGTDAVTVQWTTTGAQNISVNYTNSFNCEGLTPFSRTVNVHPLPVPSISGPSSSCLNTSSTFTTESGMGGYTWTVSGGTISSGAGTYSITVNWTSTGSQSVTVTYNDLNGCAASAPTSLAFTVLPLPVPVISGNGSVCEGSVHQYTTAAGMTGYVWNVSAGGSITSGAGTNTIDVSWPVAGPQSVDVNYVSADGCTAGSPTVYNVTVNPLPLPAISGPVAACFNSSQVYTTAAGMTGYIWSVNGGSITAGSGTNSVTVTWNTAGNQSVSVNYTDANGCTALTPSVYAVTVHDLPVPVISGAGAMCLNNSATYTTAAGMSNYTWVVNGGNITSGGGTGENSVTVTWATLGTQSVSVNYTDGNSCSAASPTVFPVVVNTLPVPTITGPASVCAGLSATYTTESGLTSYTWNVSAGGNITSGAGTNSITVLWNTVGPQLVDVNYVIGTGCTALTPTVKNITVNALPAPTVSGQAAVCQNTSHVYSTQSGMSGYLWTVPPEGSITSGSGTNSITVLWTSPGTPVISVNYTNSNGCTAVSPANYPITVNPAPLPLISGPAAVCRNTSSTYSVQNGMSGYLWTVTGGAITGGQSTSAITVLWNTTGSQTITSAYTDLNGCIPITPSSYAVTVNSLPTPLITGPSQLCANATGALYTSPLVASHDYVWTVTGALSFTGNHTNSITVDWGAGPLGTVQLNEVDQSQPTNCNTLTPAFNVTLHPNPAPVILGNATPCGLTVQPYTIAGGTVVNHSYLWTVSGGTPVSGTNSGITVTWGNTNPVSIVMQESITYGPGMSCTTVAPAFPVTLVLIPDAAGLISGPTSVCQGLVKTYTVSPITNADSYSWWFTPSGGVTITNNGASADLNFGLTSASGSLQVKGNKTGCASGPSSPALAVNVHSAPYVSLAACMDLKTTSTSRPFQMKGGVPPGGVYNIDGAAAADNIFTPASLSTTVHQVTYTYTDVNTCINTSAPVSITVIPGSPAGSCPSTFTDPRDNTVYRTISMGMRCWMLENLSYGSVLSPAAQHQKDNCTPEKYCHSSDPACSTFGGLYQWDELMQYLDASPGTLVQGLCPPEWHVPTATEWQLLIDGQVNAGNGIAGSDLRDLTPIFGFHALLGGLFYQNSLWNFENGTLTASMFWTSTKSGSNRALARGLNSINPSVSTYHSLRSNAFSVRCVKD